jgi:hypothetical protein
MSARVPFLICAAACMAGLRAQGGAAGPDPEVAAKLALLEAIVDDKKMARDDEARDVFVALVAKWRAGLPEKDRKKVLDGLGAVFTAGKVRPPTVQLYRTAAAALGELGEAAAKPLEAAYANKNRFPARREWLPLREDLLRAIGRTKDRSRVAFLLDVARNEHEAVLQAAAGEALGNFADSPLPVRRAIVGDLLAKYREIDGKARELEQGDVEAQNARDRLRVLADEWNTALGRLTGQQFKQQPDWQEWYNKNKDKVEAWK